MSKKIVYLKGRARKSDCEKVPGCIGVTGFQLNSEWNSTFQSFTIRSCGKENRGGSRAGSGRETRQPTVRLSINTLVYERLRSRVRQLKKASGMAVSIKEHASCIVLNNPDIKEVAKYIRAWGSESQSQFRMSEEAFSRLEELVDKISPLRSDIFVNRSNVFIAIFLATEAKNRDAKAS